MPKVTIERARALREAAQEFIDKVDRGETKSKRSYAAFKAALLAYETENPWRDADTELPPKGTLVEVCGSQSHLSRNRHFLCYALHMPEYRPLKPWRTIQHDALSDYGWEPLFWRYPEPLPTMPE